MENGHSVYRHTTPSGKVYIGVTGQDVNNRWHNGKGYETQIFGRAVKKYGWENIKHEVLFQGLTQEEAFEREMELIQKHKSNDPAYGYNRTNGGDGAKGYVFTDEARQKMREATTKLWADEEMRTKLLAHLKELNESRIGKAMPIEAVRKSAIARGRKVSQYTLSGEYVCTHLTATDAAKAVGRKGNSDIIMCCKRKRNYAQGFIWRYADECEQTVIEPAPKRKCREIPIEQYTKDGEFVRAFKSFKEAERELGFSSKTLNNCARGRRRAAYGYVWRYADEGK